MKRFAVIACCLCFILFPTYSSAAKEWRGIVPLRSTRDDVRKLFGKPLSQYNIFDHYKFDEDRVSIYYADEPCLNGLRYYWGNYGVSAGTALTITVDFEEGIPLNKLAMPDLKKLRKETDSTFTDSYFDKEQGVEYSVQDGKVISITYGPAESDSYLLCSKDEREEN